MFSDRLWILKAAAALGLLAWLCSTSSRHLSARYPDLDRVALEGASLRDYTIHLAGFKVHASDASGFEINTQVGPMRVLTPEPPPAGSYVSVSARPTGLRTLEALRLDVHPGYVWKRPLNYLVSVLTILAYLWLIRRRFRWTIQDGVFRSRY